MAATSNCPYCHERVTVPEGIDPEAVVRCPICSAEFPLQQAVASTEIPPAVVPVSQGIEETSEGLSIAEEPIPAEPHAAESPMEYGVADDIHSPEHAAAEVYDFGGPAPGSHFGSPAAAALRRNPPRSPLGKIGKFIGMAVAGLVGIAVAYFVLSLML